MPAKIMPTMRCKLCGKAVLLDCGVASCVNMGCRLHGCRQ